MYGDNVNDTEIISDKPDYCIRTDCNDGLFWMKHYKEKKYKWIRTSDIGAIRVIKETKQAGSLYETLTLGALFGDAGAFYGSGLGRKDEVRYYIDFEKRDGSAVFRIDCGRVDGAVVNRLADSFVNLANSITGYHDELENERQRIESQIRQEAVTRSTLGSVGGSVQEDDDEEKKNPITIIREKHREYIEEGWNDFTKLTAKQWLRAHDFSLQEIEAVIDKAGVNWVDVGFQYVCKNNEEIDSDNFVFDCLPDNYRQILDSEHFSEKEIDEIIELMDAGFETHIYRELFADMKDYYEDQTEFEENLPRISQSYLRNGYSEKCFNRAVKRARDEMGWNNTDY